MKKLLWKIRFTVRFCHLTAMPLRYGWLVAGSWMEMLNGDTSENPAECAEDEVEEGLRG